MASFQKYREKSVKPANLLEANLEAGVTDARHLQSLGLVMENGKPRFKIDESMSRTIGLDSSKSTHNTVQSTPNSMDLEEESFVVLGKDSLNSFRASSLALYSQIQQKSMLTDYNSMISSLSAEQTEQKLKELLQENVKLKETLQQNNLAMKQQFNTLAAWQEEIRKVHQSHKEKFNETKKLINLLREENAELKTKMSQGPETTSDDLKVKELQAELQKALLGQKTVQSVKELELEETNSKLTKELNDSKTAYDVLTSDLNRYIALSNRLSQQLKQAELNIEALKLKENEQLTSFADFSFLSTTAKEKTEMVEALKEKNLHQDKEIEQLQKLVTALDHELNVARQTLFPKIEIHTGDTCSRLPSKDREQFIRNVRQYDNTIQRFSHFYKRQGISYTSVQQCLRESIKILQNLEKMQSSEDTTIIKKDMLDKLIDYQSFLNEEQLAMINERQEMIEAQKEFQKIFSDYNSVLYELEIMYEENAKLSYQQNENIKVAIERNNLETEAIVEEKKENSMKEKESLQNMETGATQNKILQAEQKVLNELLGEHERLNNSLNQQKLIQEQEQRAFQMEKNNLQEIIKDLQINNEKLEEILKSNVETIDRLKAEIKSLTEKIEELSLLPAQLEIYKADFEEERKARERLSEKNDKILNDLKNLQKLHTDLLATIEGSKKVQAQQQFQQQQAFSNSQAQSGSESNEVSTPVITAFSCPKCSLSFTALRPLQEHVEECLELQ